MKPKIILFSFCFLLLASSAAFAQAGTWRGYVFVDGAIAPNGTLVEAFLNSNTTAAVSTTTPTESAKGQGYYILNVEGQAGDTVSFKVSALVLIAANGTNNASQPWGVGWHPSLGVTDYFNLSVNTTANGGACTLNASCASGFCVHSVCRAASTFCGDNFCDSGESSSSCSADCGAAPTTPSTGGGSGPSGGGGAAAPTTPSAPTPSGPAQITDTPTINELLTAVTPSSIGLTSASAADVTVTQTVSIGATESTSAASIQVAISQVADAQARTVLENIRSAISGGSSSSVTVSKTLEVFEVKAKTTGQTTKVSRISLSFTAPTTLENVVIVEVIPKSVATSVAQIIFNIPPTILQADPVVQWQYDRVERGQQKDMSYTVNKEVKSIDSTTVSTAKAAPAPPAPSPIIPPIVLPEIRVDTNAMIAAFVIILIILFVVYWVLTHRKKKGHKEHSVFPSYEPHK